MSINPHTPIRVNTGLTEMGAPSLDISNSTNPVPPELIATILASLSSIQIATIRLASRGSLAVIGCLQTAFIRFESYFELTHSITLDELRDLRGFNPNASYNKPFKLDLSGSDITDAELQDIIQHFPNITEINAEDCDNLTDVGVASLGNLRNLESVTLAGCDISNAALANFGNLTKLRSINLRGCDQITDAGLAHLANLVNLEILNLSGCDITDAGLAHLANLVNLEILNLSGNRRITDLQSLANLSKLTHLILTGCNQITRLQPLANLINLIHLDLSLCTQIADDELQHLANLAHLISLTLAESTITDVGVGYLRHLTNLSILSLAGCLGITGTGFQLFRNSALTRVDLSGCEGITDDGVECLGRLRHLASLDLAGCEQVSNTGIQHLRDLINLMNLDVIGCNITRNGLQQHLGHMASLTINS